MLANRFYMCLVLLVMDKSSQLNHMTTSVDAPFAPPSPPDFNVACPWIAGWIFSHRTFFRTKVRNSAKSKINLLPNIEIGGVWGDNANISETVC